MRTAAAPAFWLTLWSYGWIAWPLVAYGLARIGLPRLLIQAAATAIVVAGFAAGGHGDIVGLVVGYLVPGGLAANLAQKGRLFDDAASLRPVMGLFSPEPRETAPPGRSTLVVTKAEAQDAPHAASRKTIAQTLSGRAPTVSRRRRWFS